MIEQGFKQPTLPEWHYFTPAWADVEDQHVFQRALVNVAQGQATVKDAIDQAFKEAEAIFARYPMESVATHG